MQQHGGPVDNPAKWREYRKKMINIIWHHLYMESKYDKNAIYEIETDKTKQNKTYSYWNGKCGRGII